MSVQKQIDHLLAQRAAEWIEVMRGEPDRRNRDQFVAWLCESPRHIEEVLKIVAISREARAALRQTGVDANGLGRCARTNVTPLAPPSPPLSEGASKRRRTSLWLWAAAITGAVFLALLKFWSSGAWPGPQRYASDVGEQRTLELADGSVVYLNAASTVQVHLGPNARDIRLSGEALFRVAHDSERPFRVWTRDAVIKAIGTTFNVATRASGTQVAVLEGKVQVAESRAAGAGDSPKRVAAATQQAFLEAGEAARITRAGAIERRPAEDAAHATAWRQRQLVFEGTVLEEAVEEFNRYRRSRPLRLDGIAPGSHHYSGTFNADDPESFAALLSRERDLQVEWRDDEIVIRPR